MSPRAIKKRVRQVPKSLNRCGFLVPFFAAYMYMYCCHALCLIRRSSQLFHVYQFASSMMYKWFSRLFLSRRHKSRKIHTICINASIKVMRFIYYTISRIFLHERRKYSAAKENKTYCITYISHNFQLRRIKRTNKWMNVNKKTEQHIGKHCVRGIRNGFSGDKLGSQTRSRKREGTKDENYFSDTNKIISIAAVLKLFDECVQSLPFLRSLQLNYFNYF